MDNTRLENSVLAESQILIVGSHSGSSNRGVSERDRGFHNFPCSAYYSLCVGLTWCYVCDCRTKQCGGSCSASDEGCRWVIMSYCGLTAVRSEVTALCKVGGTSVP